jgi:hypothetical protein
MLCKSILIVFPFHRSSMEKETLFVLRKRNNSYKNVTKTYNGDYENWQENDLYR